MATAIRTKRLELTEFTVEDTPFILELLNTPGWLKFIGDRNVHTNEAAVGYLQNGPMASYRENGFGLWKVSLHDGTPIGMCGLLKRTELECPDIGFAFLPAYERQGYAFEASSAALQRAKEVYHIAKLFAIVQPDNERSISLLRRQGFQFVKLITVPPKDEVLQLHSLKLER